jgi:hypothetical protein
VSTFLAEVSVEVRIVSGAALAAESTELVTVEGEELLLAQAVIAATAAITIKNFFIGNSITINSAKLLIFSGRKAAAEHP